MGVDINQIIMWTVIALGSNLLLWLWATQSQTVVCPPLDFSYEEENLTYDIGSQSHSAEVGYKDIISLAIGRCDGLPFWLIIIFEIPLIIGGFYIARAFIGAT
jgi:hypothetical protein